MQGPLPSIPVVEGPCIRPQGSALQGFSFREPESAREIQNHMGPDILLEVFIINSRCLEDHRGAPKLAKPRLFFRPDPGVGKWQGK